MTEVLKVECLKLGLPWKNRNHIHYLWFIARVYFNVLAKHIPSERDFCYKHFYMLWCSPYKSVLLKGKCPSLPVTLTCCLLLGHMSNSNLVVNLNLSIFNLTLINNWNKQSKLRHAFEEIYLASKIRVLGVPGWLEFFGGRGNSKTLSLRITC